MADRGSAPGIGSLTLGALSCLFIGIAAPYITNVIAGTTMFLDFDTPGAMLLLLLLTLALNGLMRRVSPVFGVSRGTLALVYVMMITASAIVTLGFVQNLIPTLAGVRYYAKTSTDWETEILPRLTGWIAPSGERAVGAFFSGLKPGETIPWSAWRAPLICWGVFMVAMSVVMIAMMSILRKQWVEHERLAFPLARLPLMMIETDTRDIAPFFRQTVVWVGFAAAFAVVSVNCLHHYFPDVAPKIPLRNYLYLDGQRPVLNLVMVFPIIGFTFLISTKVSFSMWFFCLLGILQHHTSRGYGFQIGAKDPFSSVSALMSHLGTGAAFVFVARSLWIGREHLGRTLRCAIGSRDEPPDSAELLPHRVAWLLLITGMAVLHFWLCMAGMSALAALVCLLGAFVCFLALTRAVAQTGIAASGSPIIPCAFTIRTLGSRLLTGSDLVSLAFTWSWASDMRSFVMASAANGARIASDMPSRRRWIFCVGMLVAVIVTFASASSTVLWLAYRHGGNHLDPWFFRWAPTMPFRYVVGHIKHPSGPDVARYIATLSGMLFMGFLLLMQAKLYWWPFHPIGYLIGTTYIITWFWFSIFLAWLAKVLIQQYGGKPAYEKTRDFLLGMVLGQFAAGGFWILVDFVTGHTGNRIPMV